MSIAGCCWAETRNPSNDLTNELTSDRKKTTWLRPVLTKQLQCSLCWRFSSDFGYINKLFITKYFGKKMFPMSRHLILRSMCRLKRVVNTPTVLRQQVCTFQLEFSLLKVGLTYSSQEQFPLFFLSTNI